MMSTAPFFYELHYEINMRDMKDFMILQIIGLGYKYNAENNRET